MLKYNIYDEIGVNYMSLDNIKEYFNNIKDYMLDNDNMKLIIIIASSIAVFLFAVIFMLTINAKKKKHRKALEILRKRIHSLKHNDVINNYTTYDNLKNDQKLGLLVSRWKKAIESLVREVDAQYSMLDVLEDAIDSNSYKDFKNLIEQVYEDIDNLENTAEKLNEEISEYVDKASDNRRYINKYFEMYNEIRDKFRENEYQYDQASDNVKIFLDSISEKFILCHKLIRESKFEDADNIASTIFKDIKLIDKFIEIVPGHLNTFNSVITPGFEKLQNLGKKFTKDEYDVLGVNFTEEYNKNYSIFKQLKEDLINLQIDNLDVKVLDLENFIKNFTSDLEQGLSSKSYVSQNIDYQNEYLNKVENTAKNFISIFKVAQGSYNITDKEIKTIEDILYKIKTIKLNLVDNTNKFDEKKVSYDELKTYLETSYNELTEISKYLDENIKIIDEIYSDEKAAREKVSIMTEKINGTKKYIKYAHLNEYEKYLEIIESLNLELTNLYLLLGDFPIDIVTLNKSIDIMINKVEKTTQELNSYIYKTLLTEFVLLYANRFYYDKQYQKELLIAENFYYNSHYNKAYERVMNILEKINPTNKKIVLEKYQEKFSEIFK